jgi:hypothetical protein
MTTSSTFGEQLLFTQHLLWETDLSVSDCLARLSELSQKKGAFSTHRVELRPIDADNAHATVMLYRRGRYNDERYLVLDVTLSQQDGHTVIDGKIQNSTRFALEMVVLLLGVILLSLAIINAGEFFAGLFCAGGMMLITVFILLQQIKDRAALIADVQAACGVGGKRKYGA